MARDHRLNDMGGRRRLTPEVQLRGRRRKDTKRLIGANRREPRHPKGKHLVSCNARYAATSGRQGGVGVQASLGRVARGAATARGRLSVGGADGPAQARGARPNDLTEIFGASKHVGPARVHAAHMFRRSEVPRTERDRSRSHPKTYNAPRGVGITPQLSCKGIK